MTAILLPLTAGVICWLIVRERSLRDRVDELRRRQDRHDLELAKLRQQLDALSAAPEATPDSEAALSPIPVAAAKVVSTAPPPLPRAPVAAGVPPQPTAAQAAPLVPPSRPAVPPPAVTKAPTPASVPTSKPAFNW
jgi:hypothetical protein